MANTDSRVNDYLAQLYNGPDENDGEYYTVRQATDARFREAIGSGEGDPPPTTGQLWPRGT